MNVQLLAFATAADAIGRDRSTLELPPSVVNIGDLKAHLDERHPNLGGLWTRLAIALDGEVVDNDATLREGCEVALLPPVSGGAVESPELSEPPTAEVSTHHLTEQALDAGQLQRQVENPLCGAVLIFAGNVRSTHRSEDGDLRAVTAIDYSAYRSMAEQRIDRIETELAQHWRVQTQQPVQVRIQHRLGTVDAGETSVLIAVASAHRDACYQASREALERLKKEVPIWKHERFADGTTTWREVEPLT